jgi:hypothetical protein
MTFMCSSDRDEPVLVRIGWTSIGHDVVEAERAALSALERLHSLERWRAIAPVIIGEGLIGGRRYTVESVLPGVDGRRLVDGAHERIVRLIASAIAPLYAHTAVGYAGDAVATQLVEGSLTLLGRASVAHHPALSRLRRRWESSPPGRELVCSRVHGDLWPGNAMLTRDGSDVTGLVDWASSRPDGLAAADLAHLMISVRALVSGCDPGEAVARLLDGRAPLEAYERELLYEHGAGALEVLTVEDVVLLAWLQHVEQVLSTANLWLPRLWCRRNVDPVLALL